MKQTLIPENAYVAQYTATSRISTIKMDIAKQNDSNFLIVYGYHVCIMIMIYPVYLNLYIHNLSNPFSIDTSYMNKHCMIMFFPEATFGYILQLVLYVSPVLY